MAFLLRVLRIYEALMANYINNNKAHSIAKLCRAEVVSRELQSTDGRRLFFCLLDFALEPALIATVQQKLQPPGFFAVLNLDTSQV